MMFSKNFLAVLFLMLIFSPSAYAGRVDLTTYYPPVSAIKFRNLKSTSDSSFATTSGNVGIGTSSPAYKLEVKGSIVNSLPSQGYLALSGDCTTFAAGAKPTLRTNGQCIYFDARGTYTGYICYNSGFTDVSDAKLKTNITTVGNAFEKLSQIKGVTYAWKDGRDHYARHIGVLAQDVEKVAPELVSQPPTGLKGVSYGGLNALTIEAIKEQQQESKEQQRHTAFYAVRKTGR